MKPEEIDYCKDGSDPIIMLNELAKYFEDWLKRYSANTGDVSREQKQDFFRGYIAGYLRGKR